MTPCEVRSSSISRASRGRGAEVEDDVGAAPWDCDEAAKAVVAVVCVFATVCDPLVDDAGTPLVCGWLEAIIGKSCARTAAAPSISLEA